MLPSTFNLEDRLAELHGTRQQQRSARQILDAALANAPAHPLREPLRSQDRATSARAGSAPRSLPTHLATR